jgi:hypothetical protein
MMLRFVIALLGVVAVSSAFLFSQASAIASSIGDSGTPGESLRVGGALPGNLESLLSGTVGRSPGLRRNTLAQRIDSRKKTAAFRPLPVVQASAKRDMHVQLKDVYAGTLSGSVGHVLFKGLPDPMNSHWGIKSSHEPEPLALRSPSLLDRGQVEDVLMPGNNLLSVGNFPAGPESRFRNLEIEVSHSRHLLKLLGNSYFGKKDVIFECRVGLGSPEFPTPVGVYFVTHIYDKEPWWIPPANRAWAAGHSPSKTVYGGTMAPLLKKRRSRSRKRSSSATEDKIEGRVSLEDYDYRFHGTNSPRSIGRNQSHGCVRMLPKDAKKVGALIKEYVGIVDRMEAKNGTFVLLRSPVRLNLVK